jgi:hypothetical protein
MIPVMPDDWFVSPGWMDVPGADSPADFVPPWLPGYDLLYESLVSLVFDSIQRDHEARLAAYGESPLGGRENVEVVTGEEFVGWSQPPRPADVIVSFDSKASKRDQARAVLYDYYHDDPLRYWSDNEAVKRCFIGGSDPRKEDHDPLLLIAAYENPKHKVWQCQGTGMTWKDLDKAVQQAIAHRRKLGPLPKSSYDTDPVVIYYYDNDKMKRITYPKLEIPEALNPNNSTWWAAAHTQSGDAAKAGGLEDIHTREADDPKKIQVERENPGWTTKEKKQALKSKYSWLSDMDSGSAGDWQSEGPAYDKDIPGRGIIASITGALLAVVSAVATATGFGAAVGVPLAAATPAITGAINMADQALHAGDFGAALSNIGTVLMQAGAAALSQGHVNIPPAAVKALGGAVNAIAKDIQAGQQQKLDFGQLWAQLAAKSKSYGSKIGDDEAHAIEAMIGNGSAKHVFIEGYLAGKFIDQKNLGAISKMLQAYAEFADPRIINVALLGMGIGFLSKAQQGGGAVVRPSPRAKVAPAPGSAQHAAHGDFVGAFGDDFAGQIIVRDAHEDLDDFVGFLENRYYGCTSCDGQEVVGFTCPEGYDLVATDHQIACAYRKKAACLGGHSDESGNFVCMEWDYPPCPPGMVNMPGSPKNWCSPNPYAAARGEFSVGQAADFEVGEAPDFGALSRGCPLGFWWDSLSGVCRPVR